MLLSASDNVNLKFQEYLNSTSTLQTSVRDESCLSDTVKNDVTQNETLAENNDVTQTDQMSEDDDDRQTDDHDGREEEIDTNDNDNDVISSSKKRRIELPNSTSTAFSDNTANAPPLSAGFSLQLPASPLPISSDNSGPGGKPERRSLIPFFSFSRPKAKSRKIVFSLLGSLEKKSVLFVPPISYFYVNLTTR